VESFSWWQVVWNWFERKLLRRDEPPLIPRRRGWHEFVAMVERGDGDPTVSSGAARELERQLNSVAPRHVRVEILTGPGGVAVRARSLRWLAWHSSFAPNARAGEDEEVERELTNVLLSVQSFFFNHGRRAWPSETKLAEAPEPDAVDVRERMNAWDRGCPIPNVAIYDDVVHVHWERDGKVVLALDPIPVN
jgi:hypothetical protein